MNTHKERQLFLEKELREYEAETTMTEEERQSLHEWVAGGRSVHDNGWYACWDGGAPMDFLDAYRKIREEDEMINAMNGVRQDCSPQEDPGWGRQPLPSPTYCDQRRWISDLYRKYMLCWEVIVMNDLRDEACEYIERHLLDSTPFDVVTDWL